MWRHLVLVVFSLAGLALADRDVIEQRCIIGDVPDGVSGAVTYWYPEEMGSPGTINCSAGSIARCIQHIDSNFLSGRSWYLTQDRTYFGQGYNPNMFQNYNLECPEGHFLNLAFQGNLSLICTTGLSDSVRVNTSRGVTLKLCNNNDVAASYMAEPGILLESGKARVDFCSDADGMNHGFYIRGTCINPLLAYNQPGCVSYQFFLDWDPEFVTSIAGMFDMVSTTAVPHKRSAEEYSNSFENIRDKLEELKVVEREQRELIRKAKKEGKLSRDKRGVRYAFTFPAGTEIIYELYKLIFSFPNGTVRTFDVYCLTANNPLYGTRVYTQNASRQTGDTTGSTTITFTGPGSVDIAPNSDRTSILATLLWTPPEPYEDFLETEGFQQHLITQRIYDYIVAQWASAYVVVDDFLARTLDPPAYPMTGGPGDFFFPTKVRTKNQVGIVCTEVDEEDSRCRRVVRFDVAPLENATIDQDLLDFCAFFQYACEPVLATACREIMILDPFDMPRGRMMVGGD